MKRYDWANQWENQPEPDTKTRVTWCPTCNQLEVVKMYYRGDPVLECGHILTLPVQEKRDEADARMKKSQEAYEKALQTFKGRASYWWMILKIDGVLASLNHLDIFWIKKP